MYSNPGLSPVWRRRGDVREEEGVAARFQHQGREEESLDVSGSGGLRPVYGAATSGRRRDVAADNRP